VGAFALSRGGAERRSSWLSPRAFSRPPLALVAVFPILSGCVLDTIKPTLDVDTPTAYRAARAGPAPPPSIDWPRQFRSAELTRLAADAQAGNLDIAAAIARIAQADAQAKIASAALYPMLNATGNAQRGFTPGTLHTKEHPFKTSAENLFSLGLTASYEVDFWGLNAANARAGRLTAEASRFDRDVVALTTAASVANTYFQILGAQDRLHIARSNAATAERALAAIKSKLAVGTGTAIDVAQEESVVATQRAAIPPLQQTVEQSRNLLAVLMGRTPESASIHGGSLDRLAAPRVPPGIPSELLLRRPDISEAEAKLAAQNASVYAARAAFLPNIQLTAQGGVESLLLRSLFHSDAVFGQIAAGITQPIFNGFNLQGQLELQQGMQAELLQTYRKAIIQAFTDVENALIAIEQTGSHERLQSDVVAASRKAYQLTEQQLHEGTIDITTLTTIQQTLFQAEDLQSQIRLQRFQAIVSLYQALGGGWTRDIYPVTADDQPATEPGLVSPPGLAHGPGDTQ
jgi:outer membrane protein, multidrug efflux system